MPKHISLTTASLPCLPFRGPDIRIVVLRAEGSMFCAGGDPKHFFDALAMSEREDRKERNLSYCRCI